MKIRNYLLSGCLIAALCSCGTSQKENLNLTLSKDTLFDKVKGAWAGQILGCTYGGPTEFQYLSTMIPDSVVIPWGNGEIKKWFDGGGGLYDDVYVDLTFVETFERCGLDANTAYANTCAVLELFGRADIPVFLGSEHPSWPARSR